MAGKKECRCAGCGRKFEAGEKVHRIATGTFTEDGFSEKKEWGLLHDDCFNRAVESPRAVLDEVKRLASETTPQTPKKVA